MNVLIYFYYFIFYSFLGWIIDSTYSSLKNKRFINRSFLTGPFSPIYGFTAIIIIPTAYYFHSNLILFFITSALIGACIEYISSLFFDKIYHIRWWNYSDQPFNINGRVCLEKTIYWGVLSVLILNTFQPTINNLSLYLAKNLGIFTFLIFFTYLLVDIIHTFGSLHQFNQFLSRPIKNNKIKLNYKLKRLIKSFPHLKFSRFQR